MSDSGVAGGIEGACTTVERSAHVLLEAMGALTKATKSLSRAAHDGDLGRIRAQAERLPSLADTVRMCAASAASAWPMSAEQEEAYLTDDYTNELLAAAKDAQLAIVPIGDQLAAFPSLVRVLPGQRAVRIDRKKVNVLRPSRLAALLKAAQAKKPKTAPESFLELLYTAYQRMSAGDQQAQGVRLAEIYELLTLLPDARRAYERAEFARDLYLLDRSGIHTTKSGASLRLTAATATRSGRDVFTVVGPEGETHTYYGVRFSEAQS